MAPSHAPSYRTAIACVTLLLAGQASLMARADAPASQDKFKRATPPGFSAEVNTGADHSLLWRDRLRPDIVWVSQLGKPNSFVLVPASIPSFRKLLRDAGFDAEAVKAYLSFSAVQAGEAYCLGLAATPERCVNVELRLNEQKQLELLADDRSARLTAAVVSNELSLVGSSYLYFGGARQWLLFEYGSGRLSLFGLE